LKKVIEGKVYNTETADLIADAGYSNGGDFQYWYEELYITQKGQFFLYGEGGPMSRYGRSVGNNTTSGSSNIQLYSKEEAFQWCEENDIEADVIAEYFEIEEG
jgi:hypothetical protein